MNRKIFNFLVLVVTILLINLLSNFIADYFITKYKGHTSYLKFTAIGMGVIVIIFYPAFEYLNGIVEKITTRFLKKGNNLFGRILGVYIAFFVMLFILYCLYARVWFDANVIKVIFNSIFNWH